MARLTGDRIILREFEKEDLGHMRMWVNDPETVDNLSDIFLYPHTVNESQRWLDSVLEGKSEMKCFVIAEKATGRYIGQLGIAKIDWRSRVGELGIVIGDRELRGKGYGSEAIRLLLEFAFDTLNLHRMELTTYEFNTAGHRCYLKCGFREEGRKRRNLFRKGRYWDTVIMGILADEFRERRS